MNAFEFAFYRYVATLMTPDEQKKAQRLAARAERGDEKAAAELMKFTSRVFFRPAMESLE